VGIKQIEVLSSFKRKEHRQNKCTFKRLKVVQIPTSINQLACFVLFLFSMDLVSQEMF